MKPIINAQIESTKLGFDRGTFLTFWLHLKFDGCLHQGFGGYVFDSWDENKKDRSCIGGASAGFGAESIRRLLEAVGAEKWEDLRGMYVRIRRSGDGFGADIEAVGHIVKDTWFDPKGLAEEMGIRS